MGAVQRLATVVILGLVALAGILILYLADEGNRLDSRAEAQQHDAVERAMATYLSQCIACHGPAGEGALGGDGRVGLPIGGDTNATILNQTGNDPRTGLPWSDPSNPQFGSGLEGRANYIRNRIHVGARNADGTYRMPAFGAEYNGPLNDAQIDELVTFIQHVDWNEVYNHAIDEYGGYPTAPAAEAPEEEATPAGGDGGNGGSGAAVELDMVDIAFEPTELTIPANTDVTINLINKGALPHAFQLADGSISSEEIAGGASGSVVVNLPPGEYDFICPVPGHADAGMVGKLIVSEDAGLPGGDPETSPEASPEASPVEGDGAPTTVALNMVDIAFEPTELTIPANVDVTIELTNSGALPHAFELADGSVASEEIAGGGTGSVVVNLPPGEYDFICPVPGHKDAGMVGKLIVTEDAAGESAAPPTDEGGQATEGEAPAGDAGGGGASAAVTVNMVDLAFEPVEVRIAANTDVTITLTNSGALPHTMEITDQGLAAPEIPGGGTGELVVNLPPGTYEFICPVPGHADAGMVGTLIVE